MKWFSHEFVGPWAVKMLRNCELFDIITVSGTRFKVTVLKFIFEKIYFDVPEIAAQNFQ